MSGDRSQRAQVFDSRFSDVAPERGEIPANGDRIVWPAGFGFLADGGLDVETIADAGLLAVRWGVPLHRVLLSTGAITPRRYVSLLAAALEVPMATAGTDGAFAAAAPVGWQAVFDRQVKSAGPGATIAIDAETLAPEDVAAIVDEALRAGDTALLATSRSSDAI